MVARTRHNVSTLSCFSLWPLFFALSRVRKQLCCTYALLRMKGLTSSCIADWQIPPSYKGVPCLFLQPKNASVFAEEWRQFLLHSAIFAAIFCRFVRRRLLTHSFAATFTVYGSWVKNNWALTVTSKHDNFWQHTVHLWIYRKIFIWFKKICFVSRLYNCQ